MNRILSLCLTLLATVSLWAAFTPAAFTVSESGNKVLFSQGNLQCSGVTSGNYTWSFAEKQYDMLGTANVSDGALADKIDLFGWSGSKGTAKWGVNMAMLSDYYRGDFMDWGQNIIGSYPPNDYRTLTNDEWLYLLNTRTDANKKKGVARIQISDTEYANGLILLPDSWNAPAGVTFWSGFASESSEQAYADYQTFTLAQWQQLEAAGAVFLPASGYRQGTVSSVQSAALYWSATPYSSSQAYYLYFNASKAITIENTRYRGNAVRLVQDICTISLATPDHGTLAADKTEAVAGETVTLTLSPKDAYYTLQTITVLQGETPITTTAVAGTTNQYSFTMPQGNVTITAEFEKVASAFTPAAFTITASGKKVYFSSGNLQCTLSPADTVWSFADYQTDMLGTDNVSDGAAAYDASRGYSKSGDALADKIDLFGWSGSTGTAKWGISTSTTADDYAGSLVDWGKNTGDGTAYRTLNKPEWSYLFYTRTDASSKKGVACVRLSETEYVNGIILLPDSWTCPTGITFNSGNASSTSSVEAYATQNTYTLAQWQQLEAAGAVFLPASGSRSGSSVSDVHSSGYYWIATAKSGTNQAYNLFFRSSGISISSTSSYDCGQAIRLVQDLRYAISVVSSENGTVTVDKTEGITGQAVYLTITPATGYELEKLTVKDTANKDITVYNNQKMFLMPASAVTVSATFRKIDYTIAIASCENGDVTASSIAQMGDEVTLTVTPAAYYSLKTITVLQGETPITTTAVADTTNQYTFTMPAGKVTVSAVFEKVASAFTPAAFTVSESGKQVLFSQGNLQCSGLTTNDTTWSFAEYQTEMIGADNMSGGALADTIDLFGWSGSTGAAKWGISTSTSISDYAGDFADWGQNIGDGTTYRTLTYDEWDYLLNTRTDAAKKKGVARIKLNDAGSQYVNGLILLPDSWSCPEDITFKSGFSGTSSVQAYADYQTFTLAQWQQLEAAGAVFLPASGYRYGSDVYSVQSNGRYWSATPGGTDDADVFYFYSDETNNGDRNRYFGQAVRLVQDIKYAVTLTQPEHGTLAADKTKAIAGETVTLTITPAAYYTLKTISVLQVETPITTTAVAGTTNQYTFTMPAGKVTITAVFEKVASAFTPVAFTVSESGKQVLFSQGNLQCSGLTTNDTTWSFAEYQTEMIGADNMSSEGLADKIDLFGWSGSTGSAKWGISTSTSNAAYSGNFVDWGQNTIGTNVPNTYRTLTYDEWNYLLNTRTDAAKKKGVARIKLNDDGTDYVNGLILLPDSWTDPEGITFKSGFSNTYSEQAYADKNLYTTEQWQQMEAAGAVFLPASGGRSGSGVFRVQNRGYYWSATPIDTDFACGFDFNSGNTLGGSDLRDYGQAVRLVQDIKYTLTTYAENGTVTGGGTYASGTEVVLTATPAAGFWFLQWSDGNTDNPRTITVTAALELTATFASVPSAISDATGTADTLVRKVLIDGQIYILRGSKTYTLTGKICTLPADALPAAAE